MRQGLLLLTVVALMSGTAAAQMSIARERARPYARTAWEFMRNEAWPEAAKSFQQAIEADREFEDAYYGLGLAQMRMKKYAEAIAAYVKCRDLYRAQAGKTVHEQPGRAALQTGSPDRNRRADSPDPDRAAVADLAGPRSSTSGSTSPDSGLHLEGRQRQHRKLSPRVRVGCPWQRLLPDGTVRGRRTRVQGGDRGGPEEGRGLQ